MVKSPPEVSGTQLKQSISSPQSQAWVLRYELFTFLSKIRYLITAQIKDLGALSQLNYELRHKRPKECSILDPICHITSWEFYQRV